MIKLVVFDWNGTIIADTTVSFNANNKVLIAFGAKPVSKEIYRQTIVIPQIEFYVKHGCNREELLSNKAKREKTFHDYFDDQSLHCKTGKHASEIVEWLSSNSIDSILLSNHTVIGIEMQLDRLKLQKYFSAVLANSGDESSIQGTNKLDRLKNYLKSNSYKSSQVIIVGDSPEEIEIGREVGIKTVAYTQGDYPISRLKPKNPDFLIDDLGQLKEIIKHL